MKKKMAGRLKLATLLLRPHHVVHAPAAAAEVVQPPLDAVGAGVVQRAVPVPARVTCVTRVKCHVSCVTCHVSCVAGLLLHPAAGHRGLLPGAGAGALLRQGEGEGVRGHSGQNLHSMITLIGSRMMTFSCIGNGRDIALFLMTFCKTDIV